MENQTAETVDLKRGNCVLMPWDPKGPLEMQILLPAVWHKLHAEDLYQVVFHENPLMSLSEFVAFFSRPNVVLQLCMDAKDETNPKVAGLVWLSDYEALPSHNRAIGSFVFFKDYQTPEWTDAFAAIALDYWFKILDLSVLVGMTPGPNRAAQRFSKRNGLEYLCILPKYTSYNGEPVDAMIAMLTREKYLERMKSEA